jgi:cell division protein ZapA (FtsZ GTPase activity inhibitor)
MASRSVELNVAGMTCRVVTSATDQELDQLTGMVEERLAALLKPGRPVTTQAVLLVAISLAHEASEEKARARAIAERARTTLSGLLARVDGVLATSDDLALERDGDLTTEGRGAPRKRFREEPKPRRALPDVTVDRLRDVRDVARVPKNRPRVHDKERGSE